MADYAAMELAVPRAEIAEILVLPPPTAQTIAGKVILRTTSGVGPVVTRVMLRDGTVHEVSMDCGGIPALQCQDDPQLRAESVTQGGYFDTPCSGEAPESCATPVPPPDPAAVRAAVVLRVARLDILIDSDGHYQVPVGEARLPNGILSQAEFGFAAPGWPADVTIADGVVQLQVRSLDDPGRTFTNIHDHGRVPGTERVEGVLVFDVVRHDEGAVLSIANLVIR